MDVPPVMDESVVAVCKILLQHPTSAIFTPLAAIKLLREGHLCLKMVRSLVKEGTNDDPILKEEQE